MICDGFLGYWVIENWVLCFGEGKDCWKREKLEKWSFGDGLINSWTNWFTFDLTIFYCFRISIRSNIHTIVVLTIACNIVL